MTRRYPLVIALVVAGFAGQALALEGDPSNYLERLAQLKPGETLDLTAGTYAKGLPVTGLNGTASAPITIAGPTSGAPAIFVARSCCNTVEIKDSSYVVIKQLTLDGKGLAGPFGVSAKSGVVHHITIDGLEIVDHDGSQQTVGISTKVQTWGWVIRNNRITSAGTGIYLGNSNGDHPFFDGLIEHNVIERPIGYCMQVKHQNSRKAIAGMPTGKLRTIIRHNLFWKDGRASPDGDRPNLLVGGFPDSGEGSEDLYEIYGNLLVHNPRESLLQASGRVSVHDNIFVDVVGTAIYLRDHERQLKLAHVYNNTIYGAAKGIALGSTPSVGHEIRGNLVFATDPIGGKATAMADNLTAAVGAASGYVTKPSSKLGVMDFYPLVGKVVGSPIDLSPFAGETDYDRDFNGTTKGGLTFRGAYAGEGTNPGWTLQAAIKQLSGSPPQPSSDGGVEPAADAQPPQPSGDSGSGGRDAGVEPPPGDDAGAAASSDDGGCSCSLVVGSPRLTLPLLLLAMLLLRRRRR